jgi:hypothetical protein
MNAQVDRAESFINSRDFDDKPFDPNVSSY